MEEAFASWRKVCSDSSLARAVGAMGVGLTYAGIEPILEVEWMPKICQALRCLATEPNPVRQFTNLCLFTIQVVILECVLGAGNDARARASSSSRKRFSSSLSAISALLAMALSIGGLLTPWWVSSQPAELAPIVTEVSLWTANTRWTLRMDGGVETHTGCDYKCNQARYTKPRVYSKCQTWEDMRDWAPQLCSVGVGSRAEFLVTTTTRAPTAYDEDGYVDGQYTGGEYNFEKESNPNVFVNPNSDKQGPPVPPNTQQISTYKPYEFGAPTTTVTPFFTRTSTSFTTTQVGFGTTEMTPVPLETTPILGAVWCEQPTWQERATAPYTDWELNFQLNPEILERIYAQLYHFFSRVPTFLFTQRPLRHEQVRLVWEAYVHRSPVTKWLGQWPCPSVPARDLHDYIYGSSVDSFVVLLGEQGLMPPKVKPVEWSDWALKEAWDLELLELTTTTLQNVPMLEAITSARVEYTSPEPTEAPTAPPEVEAYPADVTSFVACHLAQYDPQRDPDAPFAWYEKQNPCTIAGNLEKVWIVKGCLVFAILISMAHSFPATVLFVGSKQRFAWRFPLSIGMYMALGTFFFQAVAVISAATLVVQTSLNGPGFWCLTFGLMSSLVAAASAKMAQVALTSEEPEEYSGFAPDNWETYLAQMAQADRYMPECRLPLFFWPERHYDALLPLKREKKDAKNALSKPVEEQPDPKPVHEDVGACELPAGERIALRAAIFRQIGLKPRLQSPKHVVEQLIQHSEKYSGVAPDNWETYLAQMAQADRYMPECRLPLFFWPERHYDALLPLKREKKDAKNALSKPVEEQPDPKPVHEDVGACELPAGERIALRAAIFRQIGLKPRLQSPKIFIEQREIRVFVIWADSRSKMIYPALGEKSTAQRRIEERGD
ncbi:unnamed protein product [Effrenium voratum]|nr:unnamed protein product [Effrenium voratum]